MWPFCVTRRAGEDPTTFATELEILAIRGFGDMGTRARNRMVRDRFIEDKRSCGMRRHIDSVPPDTPIREIVDRYRVWESHSEQKRGSSPGTDMHRERTGVASDSRESTFVMKDSLWVEPWIPVSVANVVQSDLVGPQEVCGTDRGEGTSGHRNAGATGHTVFGDVGIESSIGGRAGDGVSLCGRPGHMG